MNAKQNDKRPRPYVKRYPQSELAWDPIALEQFTSVGGEPVRAGDSYAIVRPDHERWPLGHVSDVYKPTSHRRTVDMITEASSEVEPHGQPLMSGHGYRVVHEFQLKIADSAKVHGLPLTSRLTVVHDHTGLHALKARMVVYVGDDCLGSIVGARAIHVAENPERWRAEIDGMIERSRKAQEALLALLVAADKFVLGEADRATLTAMGVKPAGKEWGVTLLDSMVKYHRGHAKDITWGVWERRLTDDAVQAMVRVMGKKKYGLPLDEALGGHRYAGKQK